MPGFEHVIPAAGGEKMLCPIQFSSPLPCRVFLSQIDVL